MGGGRIRRQRTIKAGGRWEMRIDVRGELASSWSGKRDGQGGRVGQ